MVQELKVKWVRVNPGSLDMRKPHTAVNFGEQDRYHLIIDVKSDQRLRDWVGKK